MTINLPPELTNMFKLDRPVILHPLFNHRLTVLEEVWDRFGENGWVSGIPEKDWKETADQVDHDKMG